jgi:probable F420-dependent oxidoreductase
MKLGVLPPFAAGVITDPVYLKEFAQAVESAGAESLWTVEHVIVAERYEPLYPYSADGRMPSPGGGVVMPDPLHLLSFVAAHTSSLKLGTSVVVAAFHSAAILAKRCATLDALSNGRLLLGVGIGWQKEEYAAVGVPYVDRGRRLDEVIDAMRALWGPGPSTFEGRYQSFRDVHCDTKPVQPGGVPIIIGGNSEAAVRRAGLRGNGWFPYVIAPDVFRQRADLLRRTAAEAGRDPDAIEITVWPGSFAPAGTFDLELVRSYVAAGARRLVVAAYEGSSTDPSEVARFLRRYQDEVIARVAPSGRA